MWSKLGEALADSLSAFSLDVVSMVAKYVTCGCAQAKAEPSLLMSMSSMDSSRSSLGFQSIALDASGHVLACNGHTVQEFDPMGRFVKFALNDLAVAPTFVACQFSPSTTFVTCAAVAGTGGLARILKADGSLDRLNWPVIDTCGIVSMAFDHKYDHTEAPRTLLPLLLERRGLLPASVRRAQRPTHHIPDGGARGVGYCP